jgi:hypothetical protein
MDAMRLGLDVLTTIDDTSFEQVLIAYTPLSVMSTMYDPVQDMPVITKALTWSIKKPVNPNPTWDRVMIYGAAAAYRAGLIDTATMLEP